MRKKNVLAFILSMSTIVSGGLLQLAAAKASELETGNVVVEDLEETADSEKSEMQGGEKTVGESEEENKESNEEADNNTNGEAISTD